MSSRDASENLVLSVVAFLAVNLLLYGVLISERLLTSVLVVAVLYLLYLVWRLVRVNERIADGLEESGESP